MPTFPGLNPGSISATAAESARHCVELRKKTAEVDGQTRADVTAVEAEVAAIRRDASLLPSSAFAGGKGGRAEKAAMAADRNPQGRDGKPLTCAKCGSKFHLWRRCAPADPPRWRPHPFQLEIDLVWLS